MARQITYDPQELRTNLLERFWADGFAGASLADLEEATGLNRRQLYNALGDKRAMFLQALDDFQEVAGRRFLAPLETESAGVREIRRLLLQFVDLAGTKEGANGCFICSTSQEEIASDKSVRRRIDQYFDRIAGAYQNALTRADARGEITLSKKERDSAATLLFGVHVSLCVLARAGQPKSRLRRMAEEALAAIG